MEDKHYPILDEEESGLMVEESAVAVAPAPVAMEICHDFIADSVPHTLEDAIVDLLKEIHCVSRLFGICVWIPEI